MADAAKDPTEAFKAKLKPIPFSEWLPTQPEKIRALYAQYRHDPAMPNAGLVAVTKELGGHVGKDTIAEWRKS